MPLLLFFGDNDLELDEATAGVRGRHEPPNVTVLDGRSVPLQELATAVRTAGLFDPERLVVVPDLHERLKGTRKDRESEEIAEVLRGVAPTTTLLLTGAGMPADHALVKLVREAGGEIRSFVAPKPRDLPGWLVQRARREGISLAPDAAELLVELVGANPLMLHNEVTKLALYAGEQSTITPHMVELLVGAVPQDAIFKLVDAVAARRQGEALRLIRTSSNAGTMELALTLIRLLARQFRTLLRLRLARERRQPQAQIVAELRIPRYYADRYFRQADRFTTQQLAQSFERLAALEHELKTGEIEPGVGLDLLVADLCA